MKDITQIFLDTQEVAEYKAPVPRLLSDAPRGVFSQNRTRHRHPPFGSRLRRRLQATNVARFENYGGSDWRSIVFVSEQKAPDFHIKDIDHEN
jgi:hypothetical protein